jgi:hypothetical protein
VDFRTGALHIARCKKKERKQEWLPISPSLLEHFRLHFARKYIEKPQADFKMIIIIIIIRSKQIK